MIENAIILVLDVLAIPLAIAAVVVGAFVVGWVTAYWPKGSKS